MRKGSGLCPIRLAFLQIDRVGRSFEWAMPQVRVRPRNHFYTWLKRLDRNILWTMDQTIHDTMHMA